MIEVSVDITPRAGSGDPRPTEPRNFDVSILIPDWHMTWVIGGGECEPLATHKNTGKTYTHLSRVQRKEIEIGHLIYVKGSDPRVLMRGLPPTAQFLGSNHESHSVQLTGEPTDEIWWEVFNASAPSSISLSTRRDRYQKLKKDGVCFTDYTGGNAYNPVMTAGNPIYLLGDRDDIGGRPHLNFRTLKVGNLASMQAQLALYPLLKMRATNSTRDFGGAGVEPFPQLDGADVHFLPFGDGVGWVEESRVWKWSRTESLPSPYYPALLV